MIRGGNLVNVFTEEIYPADVAVYGSKIAAVGDVSGQTGPDTKVVDASGLFLVPGLIDGRLHVECSKLSVTMFANAVVPRGTTSIVSGLDQICVVAGLEGVREFLDEAARGCQHRPGPGGAPITRNTDPRRAHMVRASRVSRAYRRPGACRRLLFAGGLVPVRRPPAHQAGRAKRPEGQRNFFLGFRSRALPHGGLRL